MVVILNLLGHFFFQLHALFFNSVFCCQNIQFRGGSSSLANKLTFMFMVIVIEECAQCEENCHWISTNTTDSSVGRYGCQNKLPIQLRILIIGIIQLTSCILFIKFPISLITVK